MPLRVYDQLRQQTFLGASIVNFSANLGINGSPSTLNVNLIEDLRNNTLPPHCTDPAFISETGCLSVPGNAWIVPDRTFIGNRKGEGYHYSEPNFADVAPANIMAGKYPDEDYNGLTHTKFREPQLAGMGDIPGYNSAGVAAVNARGQLLYKFGDYFCPPPLGTPVWFNFHMYDDRGNQNPLPVPLMSSSTTSTFNGILTNYSINQSTSGRSISVEVADPRLILQGVQVILDGYKDLTPPADWSTDTITEQNFPHPANGQPTRKLHHGYNGYYNILNVFGYYENYFQWRLNVDNDDHKEKARQTGDPIKPLSGDYATGIRGTSGFGMADINEGGMRWHDATAARQINVAPDGLPPQLEDAPGFPSILIALQHMLMGWPGRNTTNNDPGVDGPPALAASTFYDDTGNESLGGPIYYVLKERLNGLGVPQPSVVNEITKPTNVYRFKVDLSDMLKLTQPVPIPGAGGIGIGMVLPPALPRYYRVKASSMNLLELIQHVCEDAHADFIVELLPDNDQPGNTFEDRSFDGILKVKIIDKRAKPDTTIIAKEIRKAEWALGGLGAAGVIRARQHQWYNRIVSYDMGKEFATEPAGKMVIGGPETRVVGADLRLGVDRIDYTKCACIKDEETGGGVVGTPVIHPAGAPTRVWCEAQGDEFHWRCARRPTEFDGVQLPGVYRLDNGGGWGQIGTIHTDNNNVYTNDWRKYLDPAIQAGYFSDLNPDYDGTDRFDVNTVTNITTVDNTPYGATGAGREIWSVWGKLIHSPLGGSFDGLDSQYVVTDVDHEYDFCNAETGHCRFERGYGDRHIVDGNGRFTPDSNNGAKQTWGLINRNGNDPIFNKDFRQDYRTDIFPCWGFFNTYENETINGVVGDEDVVITDEAMPIKGSFDEMNPYRDFHPYIGVQATRMYILTKPIDPTGGVGGVGMRGGKQNSDGKEMYDSVEYCLEKLQGEYVADVTAGLMTDYTGLIGDDVLFNEYKLKYLTPCDPSTGNRVYGYARFDTVDTDRTADEGLDTLHDGGAIDNKEYIRIIEGRYHKEDADGLVWNPLESEYQSQVPVSINVPITKNGEYLSLPSATIPIDLREAGIQGGVGGIHYASVLELRHALVGYTNWRDYCRTFDPKFAQDIGMRGKIASTHLQVTLDAHVTDENGMNPTPLVMYTSSSIHGMDTSFGTLTTTGLAPDEDDITKVHKKIYEIVKRVADNYYGKQFLVPLPYDPQRLTEYKNRTYVDDEQKIPAYKITNKWDIAQAGWVDTETDQAKANSTGGEIAGAGKVDQKDVKYPLDNRFFNGEGMLMPYMVFPHRVWVDIKYDIEDWVECMGGDTNCVQRNADNVGGDVALTKTNCAPCVDFTEPADGWKVTNHGYQKGDNSGDYFPAPWTLDTTNAEMKCRMWYQAHPEKKYTEAPQDRTFEDTFLEQCLSAGDCDAMGITINKLPNGSIDQKTSDCNHGHIKQMKEGVRLSFEPLDFGDFDRNDYYIESQRTDDPANGAYCTNAGFGDPVSCEDRHDLRKTPDGQPWDIIPGRWITDNRYLTRVFVKANVDEKTHWLKSDTYNRKMIVPPDGRTIQAEGGTGVCSDTSHDNKADCEAADKKWINFDQLRPYGLISLNGVVRYPVDTIIGHAAFSLGGASIATNLNAKLSFFGHTEFFTKMAPAAFKPWEGAIPQQSNTSSWGPWSNGSHFGAARFEEDSSLSPEQYGSNHGMNLAGSARAGLDAIEFQEQESGSVSLTGLPETPLGGRLFTGAPYITNLSVDIGTGGIKTSYRMETYKRQMGRDEMHKIQRDNRIRKAQFAREKEARDNRRYRNRPKKD